MKIGTKERLVTIIALAVIALIAAMIWWTYREVNVANGVRQQASEIARGLSQLRLLTFEYRLYHNERAKVQWYAISDRVDRQIANARISMPGQDQILARMRERRTTIRRLFAELTSAEVGSRSDAPLDPSTRLFEAQLLSRLLAEQQDNFADVFRLTDLATERISAAQQRMTIVILAGLLLVALIKGGASWLINRDLITPIVRLQRATKEVASGNWNSTLGIRSDDEIGELSKNFDAMTQSLRKSFGQIEQGSQELAQLNEGLERRVLDRTMQLESANKSLQAEIAVRQAAEHSLSESHARARAIFDTALDGIITMDHEGRIGEFNPAAEQIFDYERSEVMGQPLADVIIPPALRERHSRGLTSYLATGEAAVLGRRMELTGMRADGSSIAVELSINRMPGNGPPIFAGFVRDITARKQAEEMRTQFAALVESSDDAIIGKTLDGIIRSWNPGAQTLFGYSAEEAIGHPMLMLFPEGRADEERDVLAQIARGKSVLHFETVRVRNDRKRVDVSVTISPVRDSQGNIVGASTIARDISERKLAEGKLQAQLARLELLDQITRAIGERQDLRSILQVVLRSLEEHLPTDFCCMCLYDEIEKTLTVTAVGSRSEALASELALIENARIDIDENGLSRCVSGQLVYEPEVNELRFPFAQRLAQGGLRSLIAAPLLVESKVFGVLVTARLAADSFSSGECEFLRQLSEHVALAAHQAQLHDALQQAYDDLRQTQQMAMQQERLRALGQMASGIAHDINNAISPVALYTESLLEQEPNLSARARSYLETIQRAIGDVAQTVARMREFYRQREPQLTLARVDLNSLAQQVVDLTRARWSDMAQQGGSMIRMVTELAPKLPAIMGAENEIREALTNLIFNAVDAMPQGGTLTVRTRTAQSEPGASEAPVPRYVHVEICDTGVGMDEDTRRRCLEPFFTTKGERGTGLGLAMVYGVMRRHSSEIEIESALGTGTTMRLTFAVAEATIAGTNQPVVGHALPSRQRILTVDDDPLLLKSLRDTLETDGHVVFAANGGQAGIDAFLAAQQRGEPFTVVITDLGMPHVDGRKVAGAVKLASPSTPVILLTGWGERLIANGDVPATVNRVLSKPPKLRDLREALAQCCAGAES